MDSEIKSIWTYEALNNLEEILEYLRNRWGKWEIDRFKLKLFKNVEFIREHPLIFPVSTQLKGVRKAVLSSELSLFYKVSESAIYIVALFHNKRNLL